MGSSDSSIPSVSWLGIYSNFFSASALLAAVLSIVRTPRSTTFLSLGQGFVGSFVESPATASCALRRNVTGPRLINAATKAEMKRVLDDIQSGRFARDWGLENKAGQPSFKATRARLAAHPIEEVGERLRAMMPWITKNKLVDRAKN